MKTTTDLTIAERFADHAANEAALSKAGQEAVREHARSGFPVATVKDGKVVWLQPEEVFALLGKTAAEYPNGVHSTAGASANGHHGGCSGS